MVGWSHRLSGHESEQAPGESEGQGSLAKSMGLQRAAQDLVVEQQQHNLGELEKLDGP